jgi:hypothetical protein
MCREAWPQRGIENCTKIVQAICAATASSSMGQKAAEIGGQRWQVAGCRAEMRRSSGSHASQETRKMGTRPGRQGEERSLVGPTPPSLGMTILVGLSDDMLIASSDDILVGLPVHREKLTSGAKARPIILRIRRG